jgi:hypothetical protein
MSDVVEGLVAVKMPSKFDDSIRIKLEDGDWYSAPPAIADSIRKGATVKLKVERQGKSVFVLAVKELAFSEPASKPSGGGGSGYRGGSKPDPAREASIHYQSSRKDALTLLGIMHDTGTLALGGKKDAKLPLLMDKLDELTAAFFEDVSTQGAVKRFSSQADESADFDPDAEQAEEAAEEDFPEEDDDF